MSLARELLAAPRTVADGGWSTQLLLRGFPPGPPPETANLTHAHLVTALAREYLGAGARILTTNTFAANPLGFERRGVSLNPLEVCRTGARLAKQAIGDGPAVVGGVIGPSGKILVVREAAENDLAELFAALARALSEGGADLLVLETFSELEEILLALRAVRSAVDLPVVASLSFDSGPQRTRTMMGATAEECAFALEQAGADAIGCNCGGGIATTLPAVVALRANTKRPIWAKPSAGLPDLEAGHPVYRQTPEEFSAFVPKLLDAGVNIIGGCCGTGPEHIRRVANLAESHRRKVCAS